MASGKCDLEEVNIHKFYPDLDPTLKPKFTTRKDANLLAGQNDNRSSQRDLRRESKSAEENRDDVAETIKDVEEKNEAEKDTKASLTSKNVISANFDQAGVFSTAIDEELLEAAKKRSGGLFSSEDWQDGRHHKKVGLIQIITCRAYEHFEKALKKKEEKNVIGWITCLNKAINLKTDEPRFYVERAEAYLLLCDFQSALLNYKKVCLLESENEIYSSRLAFLYYLQGQSLFDQHFYLESLEAFSRAAEMVPDNVSYHIRSIASLAALQRYGQCLAMISKYLEVHQGNPDMYIMRARLHEMFRNPLQCYYDIQSALALDPNHCEGKMMFEKLVNQAKGNNLQAIQLSMAGKHREALHKITLAIQANPSVANYHVLRGVLHRKLNDFNAAIADFLLALDQCKHNEEDPVYKKAQRQLLLTYNDFAVQCFNQRFFEEAIILLNKAIKGEKNEKSLYVNRGDCFFKQNELTFALLDYQQALELDPHDLIVKNRISIVNNEFGVVLYRDKNYSGAEDKFSLALQSDPLVAQYYISRSRARYMMENIEEAREDLLCGLILAPSNDQCMSLLSQLFPGKSFTNVITSPAAQAAKVKLNNVKVTISPIRRKCLVLTRPNNVVDPGQNMVEVVSEPDTSYRAFALCMEDRQFYIQQVTEKKQIGSNPQHHKEICPIILQHIRTKKGDLVLSVLLSACSLVMD